MGLCSQRLELLLAGASHAAVGLLDRQPAGRAGIQCGQTPLSSRTGRRLPSLSLSFGAIGFPLRVSLLGTLLIESGHALGREGGAAGAWSGLHPLGLSVSRRCLAVVDSALIIRPAINFSRVRGTGQQHQ